MTDVTDERQLCLIRVEVSWIEIRQLSNGVARRDGHTCNGFEREHISMLPDREDLPVHSEKLPAHCSHELVGSALIDLREFFDFGCCSLIQVARRNLIERVGASILSEKSHIGGLGPRDLWV